MARGLECEGLVKEFPGVRALDAVDIAVEPGEVVCLLGENGAGKSTLVKLLSGVHQPDEGTMRLDGETYAPADAAEAIGRGIAMIHQETNLLGNLSVAENVFLGRWPTHRGVVDYDEMRDRTRTYLQRVGLDKDPATPVRRLSVAARQQVEIAKALALEGRVLILDEPTAALGDDETDQLFALVDELRGQDVGFIYISHRLSEVERIGDRIVVLRDGARVASWDRADVAVDELVEAMVGRSVDRVYPDPPTHRDEEVLVVDGLARGEDFTDVSFTLRRGEILGIAGLVGAGRTELARALFGAEPADAGTITLKGEQVTIDSPEKAVESGLVLIPEDRKEQGLVLTLSMAENVGLPSLRRLGPVVRTSQLRRLTGEQIERLDIRGQMTQSAGTLSGGNQQKAVIAKWLPTRPDVVIFDEPTRGVDVGAKESIYEAITHLAEEGVGVIVISSELPEVLGLAHRVLVLSHGRQTGVVDRAEADEERIMALAVEE